ncbi:MAG TPA: alpha/beta hydrolase [Thermomicrobiales bacterium]|nr:alpha/beta hydrolase [Thermomicrobiales bacterium]
MNHSELRSHRSTIDAVTLAWYEHGGELGSPIVCLHGLGASSLDFAWLATWPAFRHMRLLLIDAAGHGASDRPDDWPYSIEAHAELIVGLLREIAGTPVALVGHSMVCSMAIALAHRHPGLVDRLVLAEPNLDPGTGTLSGHVARQREERFVTRGYAALVYQTERTAARGDLVAAGFLQSLRLASPMVIHRSAVSLRAERLPTFHEQLETMTLPRTLLRGKRTPPLAPPLSTTAIQQVVIPGAGHQMMIDNPDAFATSIRTAIDE